MGCGGFLMTGYRESSPAASPHTPWLIDPYNSFPCLALPYPVLPSLARPCLFPPLTCYQHFAGIWSCFLTLAVNMQDLISGRKQ
jgi:hypothetical protein